jgi:ribosomal protein S24E
MKIIEQVEEPILSRKKVSATVDFEGATPTKKKITQQLSTALKVDMDAVKLMSIRTIYGERRANVSAYVYTDKDAMKVLHKVKEKKNGSS